MAENTLGKLFRMTSFGESHGIATGVVIDGLPAGFKPDMESLQRQLDRRRPGQSPLTTQRNEQDMPEIISGIYEGKTTGSPVCLIIANHDQRSKDYDPFADKYRPGHADYTYDAKYGIRDPRGGGRSSARITAGWVAAGAMAEQVLQQYIPGLTITAWVSQVHDIKAKDITPANRDEVDQSPVRCPDNLASEQIIQAIEQARHEGDSLGGLITCRISHCPAGMGEPVFGKLHARLGHAMLSINAVKGISFGDGFDAVRLKGSEMNDAFVKKHDGSIGTRTNHSGGIQGGISNGEDILFTIAFKPTSTISKDQDTVNRAGDTTAISGTGRHDPCVLPRAVPIVEALAAATLLDLWLENNAYRP